MGQNGRARGVDGHMDLPVTFLVYVYRLELGGSMGGRGIEQVIKAENGERGVRAGHAGAGLPLIT